MKSISLIWTGMAGFLMYSASPVVAQGGDTSPTQRALAIAEKSTAVQDHFRELKGIAQNIHDSELKKIALEFLSTPHFELSKRSGDEAKMKQVLLEKHLLDLATAPATLIPAHPPMPFLAAPASVWLQHHTYPGGLVFHTLTNSLNALSLAKNWEHMNHIELKMDWLRVAPIWHDIAKTWTIEWKEDGSATVSEGKIAGTGAHHILGIAEALMRKLPPDLVVVIASAHSPAHAPDELEQLIHYLQAAAIISGKPFADAGLTADGTALAKAAPLESYIHHLSDHDWVGAEPSLNEAVHGLQTAFPKLTSWQQDEFLSNYGDLKLTEVFRKSGPQGIRKLLKDR